MKKASFILFTLLMFSYIYAQDTIYLDKKMEYSSDSISLQEFRTSKIYHKSAREFIQLPNDSFKIEFCCYFDGKRINRGCINSCKIRHDSIFNHLNEIWTFKEVNTNSYTVARNDSNYRVSGIVYSVLPFIKNGEFRYMHNNTNEVFLTEHYNMGRLSDYTLPHTETDDSVFTDVDTYPEFPPEYGDLITYISNRFKYPMELAESAIQGRVILKTVITNTGKVQSIEVLRGLDKLLEVEAIKVVSTLPNFIPATVKGKYVNSCFVIPVNFKIM